MDSINLTINAKAIAPRISENETQIILQRHCNYDRKNGNLDLESIKTQKEIVSHFLEQLNKNYTKENLKNIYFLFSSSNTALENGLKRCVETTNIAMNDIKQFLQKNNISTNHIINLNDTLNYQKKVHEDKNLIEPKMFTDQTGYLEYLKEKYNGNMKDVFIAFEENKFEEVRNKLNVEGPDQIVERSVFYMNALIHYANAFHIKYPNSLLFIWNGTHYDLISPLVKQKILHCSKEDIVNVDYCGGITFTINKEQEMEVYINHFTYSLGSLNTEQLHRHF